MSGNSWDPYGPPSTGLIRLLVGLVLGLFVMMATPLAYFLPFVPAIPAFLAAVVVILAISEKQLMPVAEGLLAATLFGVVLVATDFYRWMHPL